MASSNNRTRQPSKQPPWKQGNPKPKAMRTRLTAADKNRARTRAHQAGRRYPNLVDNMWAARRTQAKVTTKDPQGGLTAAGRRAFAAKEGAHLKPGVRKPASRMRPDEMRRKGSWARRFYGRAILPPLVDSTGKPTRFALSAHAWGEPVPRTIVDARRIAAMGERLLARYRRIKARTSR
jgi:hypothetical protein